MKEIKVDETDLIEWLSICDNIIDLLVRYKVSSIFPFNLCYQTLIALKDSIHGYKKQNCNKCNSKKSCEIIANHYKKLS